MVSLDSLFGDDASVLQKTNFQLLLLVNGMPALGTALLSPVLDSLTTPFGVSATSISLMVSAFTAPPIVMIPIAGALADRYGRKPILVSSLVLFGLAGTAIASTTDFRVVLGLRLLQGVAYAGLTPIIITSIGDLYKGTEEATAQGLRFAGTGLSQTLFPVLAGLLVSIAWQYPFLLYGISFPAAVLVFRWFDEPAAQGAASPPDESDSRSYRRALFRLIRRRRVLALVIARGLGPVVWIAFLTFNSIIVVRLIGGTPTQAGVLVAVGSLTFAGAASQAGRISAVFDSRQYPLIIANGCLTAGFATVLFTPGIAIATVGITIVGIGLGTLLSLYRSIITGLAPEHLRGGLVSLAEAVSRMMITLTPVAMGSVIAMATPAMGFVSAVQLAGLGAAIIAGGGGILCLLIARTSPKIPIERPERIGN